MCDHTKINGEKIPLVSICCLAYNHEFFIRKCIDGFLMQKTNFPIEILIHDDASTDKTADIIREYEAKYPDIIKPIYQVENQYPKVTWFSGTYQYPRAKGKYIASCEGDDYWTDPYKLQKQVDFLEANPEYSVCCHRYKIYDESTGLWKNDYGHDFFNEDIEGIIFDNEFNLNKKWLSKTMTMVFRKEMIDFSSLFKYKHIYDKHLCYHLLKNGNGYCMNFEGAVYRRHSGGVYSLLSKKEKNLFHYNIFDELHKQNPNDEALKRKFNFYSELRKKDIQQEKFNKKLLGYLKNKRIYHIIRFLKRVLSDSIQIRIREPEDKLPEQVRIDASTLCQLNCKSCYMRKNNSGTVGNGYLKFIDFKNFIDNNNFIKSIELSNSGEIFLNPDLIHILKYAFENNIALTADNGVNFNTVSDEMIEALVKYQFRSINFSIDGASQEIYALYRVNGNYETVINNIKKLNYYKEKYNSDLPDLSWQYILMEHNENDVVKAKLMAEALKMKIHFRLTWDKGYIPKNTEMLRKETGLKYLNREDFFENEGKLYRQKCHQLWCSPQINWDGRLLGCCIVYKCDFGINVFKTGLQKAINSRNYILAKKMVTGKIGISQKTKNIPCTKCHRYKKMVTTGVYISNCWNN